MDTDATVYCAWCGEPFGIDVDPSAGSMQRYVEDCAVCCRPNVVTVRFDHEGMVEVQSEQE